MPLTSCLVKVCLLVLPHGAIPIKAQVLITIFLLTSIGHYLALNLYSLPFNTADSGHYKEANNFYHPIAAKSNDAYNVEDERSFQIQIGSKTMPEYPMTCDTESLHQLGKQ